jgi:GT2 family glycosyltransferase
VTRVSYLRRLAYRLYFSGFWAARCMEWLSHVLGLRRRLPKTDEKTKEVPIAMAFGAAFVLTRAFFRRFSRLDAPVFLMGEEAILGHQVRSSGGKIVYCPQLRVLHHEHQSVSRLTRRELYEITRESYRVYSRYL